MDQLDAYFPYESYRPFQREMLEQVAQCAREGGIAMIDAPTGSGKSSVVAAMLAERSGRKILSQFGPSASMNTFIRELELIRKKKRSINYSYLIGKRSLCMLSGEGDVYKRCEGVKAVSTSLMRERAEQGSLVPSKDAMITQQIRKLDAEHPVICPYFIRSRIFFSGEGSGLRMVPSTPLKAKAERVARELARPDELRDIGAGVCPYEMLLLAAQRSDVVIVNYHHLFDEEIRNQLYGNLGIEPADVMLLIDEAHNCGDVMTGIMNVVISEQVLAQADREIASVRRHLKSAAAIGQIIANIATFMQGLKNSHETEDWFDPAIFDRMVVRGSLYKDMSAVGRRPDEDQRIHQGEEHGGRGVLDERHRDAHRVSLPHLLLVHRSRLPDRLPQGGRGYFPRSAEHRPVRTDKGPRIVPSLHGPHLGHPIPDQSYQRYYFGDLPVRPCSLPNVFPKKNRMVLCAGDITTAFSMRENRENSARWPSIYGILPA